MNRVLVVDDDAMNRRVLRAILAQAGFEPFDRSDGNAALSAARSEHPDLVLLDVEMPEPDGFAVCGALKRDPATADVPVIFLTSRDRPDDRVRGLELGAADYVTKPFNPAEVRARVSTHLRLRELRRSLLAANEALIAKQAKLEEDLRAAAAIQRALLPANAAAVPGFLADWRFEPTNAVGGDLLDLHRLGPRHGAAYVLDVAGHGLPAALVAVSIARALAPDAGVAVQDTPSPPAAVFAALERDYPFDRFGLFFTIAYLLLDGAAGVVRHATAAHPAPLLLPRKGGVRMLEEGCGLLGVAPGPLFEAETALEPGDRIVLYSDGLVEEPDANGDQFGVERVAAALDASRREPLAVALDRVVAAAAAHRAGAQASDDVTLLALEWSGPP